jgi:hypothetical protein
MFENGFQNIIYKIYSLILKGLIENPISIFALCKQSPIAKFIKFCLKILFYFEN